MSRPAGLPVACAAQRPAQRLVVALLGSLLLAWPVQAGDAPASARRVSFVNDIAPIFKENCFACHDAKKRKGKLDMTSYEALRKGGDSDDPIAPGQPDSSTLFQRITSTNASRMPPRDTGDPLSKDKIALIEKWIEQGAKLDGALAANADLLRELRIRWKPPLPPAVYRYPVTVNTLAFTPDGRQIVVGGYHELTVWNAATLKLEERLYTRAERAYALAFLEDGKLAVAGGRPGQEGDLRVYNLHGPASGNQRGVAILDGVNDPRVRIAELLETDDAILCLALSPDGKQLAASGCDRLVRVWDVSGGATKARLLESFENHADWVYALTFAPNGKRLFTASRDKTTKIWDLAAKEATLTFPEHQTIVYDVLPAPDGKTAFSVGEDRVIRVWSTADGKQLRTMNGHNQAIFRIIPIGDSRQIATCSADKTVRIWERDTGKLVRALNGLNDWVYAIAVNPDATLIAAGAWNGEVRVWKLADGALADAFIASPGIKKTAVATTKPRPKPKK